MVFPVKALSKVFREKFILTQAHMNKPLSVSDEGWRKLLVALRRHDWWCTRNSRSAARPMCSIICARYTHRVAISNERLVSLHDRTVAFRVRDNANVGKKRVEQLRAETFIARFLQHVLPQGFKRIRHYGLLASCHKREKLAACRLALHAPEPVKAMIETVDAFLQRVAQINITRCTHCATGVVRVIGTITPRRTFTPMTTGPPS